MVHSHHSGGDDSRRIIENRLVNAIVCIGDGSTQIPQNPQHQLSTIHHNWHSVLAILMILSSLWVFETPNSIIERGHFDKAKK
ncbi:hypothetical protein LOK49_LG02G01874 [Camellia lanceoleosa]|uniref:Uncharacterized protein n=1 Tax=Camellia lanceoleosa TaxID=1840588 RepID=A0ACC0IJ43_9ERIC|nr:hypothetical protein LOK49_LG02G01874 [Camellia lanceoleosa]